MSEVIHMREVLFYTFIVVFLVTVFVTFAGITNFLPMESKYLDKLFPAVILESVGVVIYLFTETFIKKNGILVEKKNGNIEFQLIFPETVDTTIPNLPEAEYSFIDAECRKTKPKQCLVYPKGEGDSLESHYIKIKEAPLDKSLFVEVVMEGIPYQGAQYLGSRKMNLKSNSKELGIPEAVL